MVFALDLTELVAFWAVGFICGSASLRSQKVRALVTMTSATANLARVEKPVRPLGSFLESASQALGRNHRRILLLMI